MEQPDIRGLSEWRPLARGGRAVVWEARQQSLDRLVAVKVYEPELDEGDRLRFLREASAAGRLSAHPGIVATYAAGILSDDRPYLIMELCPGGSLSRWLEPESRPSEERVRQVGLRIADALATAHAFGVLHGDVKPANIVIDGDGETRLTDFGAATVRGAEADVPEALHVTPAYAPPEAFRLEPATEVGDVFSLAATLYALLAGRPPRQFDSSASTLEQMLEVAKRPISAIPGVSPYLMNVLMTALADDPAARPTAARFFGQLANAPLHPQKRGSHGGAGKGATATVTESERTPGQVASAEASRSRRKRRVGIMAVVVVLVTGIVSATAWLIDEPALSGVPSPVTQSATPAGAPSSVVPSTAPDSSSPAASRTPGVGATTGTGSGLGPIELERPVDSAEPFQTVQIQGTYRAGANAMLRVQRGQGGKWVSFPLPFKADESGRFTAYVELGQPGRYRLRVIDPASGVKSKTFVLLIKGD